MSKDCAPTLSLSRVPKELPAGMAILASFPRVAQLYIIAENERRRRRGTISARPNAACLTKRAANAGNDGRPIQEKWLSAYHVRCHRTELGDAAVKAIPDIVSNNKERAFRNGVRMKH